MDINPILSILFVSYSVFFGDFVGYSKEYTFIFSASQQEVLYEH